MTITTFLLAIALGGLPSSSLAPVVSPAMTDAAGCPTVPDRAANATHDIIKGKGLAKLKRQKLNDLKVKDVVPLTDAELCARLDQFYAGSPYDKDGWRHAYFTTDGYYLASLYFEGKPNQRPRRGHVAVFSGKLRLVGTADNMR